MVAALIGAAPMAIAEDGALQWQQMSPDTLRHFQEYARHVVGADADHQGDRLKLWGRRQLPLHEYGIQLGGDDPSGAMPAIIWITGQLKGSPDGQLNGASAIDFDYQWQSVTSAPSIDAAVPSIDIYVSNAPLPDIPKIELLHGDGLQRDLVHRGYGCQIARWSRNGEIVKAVGTIRMGADEGVPVHSETYGGPSSDGLTTKGLEALCASRIIAFGLGLNFVDTTFNDRQGESVMMEVAPRHFAELSPRTDQPLIELLYRSKLKPGSPKADAIALIDGLTASK